MKKFVTMKKEELQKAWRDVQERLNLPGMHIHETVLSYLEEKNRDLQLMLKILPAKDLSKTDDKKK